MYLFYHTKVIRVGSLFLLAEFYEHGVLWLQNLTAPVAVCTNYM